MKARIICTLLSLSLLFGLSACAADTVKTGADGNEKRIRLACMGISRTDSGILKIAAESFEKDNPGIAVEIVDYSGEGYDTDRYLKTMNTELMAGKGPDILPVKHLPAPKYISKKIFANLSEFIEKDAGFNLEPYFKNVLDACKYKGSMYAFPVHFKIRAVVASKEVLDKDGISPDDRKWTLADFMKIAGQVTKDLDGDGRTDRYAFPKIPMQGVAELFISTEHYIDYENLKASFDSDEFIDLLNVLKVMEDNKYTDKRLTIEKPIPYKDSQATVFSGGDIQGSRGLLAMLYCQGGGERTLLRLPSSANPDSVSFDSDLMLAINNKSRLKDYCWSFIKLLASDGIQDLYSGSDSVSGFPISRKAFGRQLDNVRMLDWRVEDGEGWVPIRITNENIKFVNDYVGDINSFTYSDSRINNIVVSELGSLFKKSSVFSSNDAKKIAGTIQNKVRLYLEE